MATKTTIFVGSTFEDLKSHRSLILNALAALKQEVEAMEFWEPVEDSPAEMCIEKVQRSQVYIGILGTRYGTITETGKSITHLEYEAAEQAGLRRLVYLLDEEKHPIVFKYVDKGLSAEKLDAFKQHVRRSVVGTFASSQDLVSQVVTHLIRHLDGLGQNVRSALKKNGIRELPVSAGFTFGMQRKGLNVASIIRMSDNEEFGIDDPLIERTLAASVIASSLKRGDFRVLDDFLTFEPDVYSMIVFLLRTYGFDEGKFSDYIVAARNPFMIRMLVHLVGDLKMNGCAQALCDVLARGRSFHREIRAQQVQVTPFNDAVVDALCKLEPKFVVPAATEALRLARNTKAWGQKQALEKVVRRLK